VLGLARLLVLLIGAAIVVGGVAIIAIGGLITGLILVIVGAAVGVVGFFERPRYRPEEEPQAPVAGWAAAGDATSLEPRFQPTEEVFVDPSTGRRMRVFLDPETGERRYRPAS